MTGFQTLTQYLFSNIVKFSIIRMVYLHNSVLYTNEHAIYGYSLFFFKDLFILCIWCCLPIEPTCQMRRTSDLNIDDCKPPCLLEIKLRTCGRAASVLNNWAISPAPALVSISLNFYIFFLLAFLYRRNSKNLSFRFHVQIWCLNISRYFIWGRTSLISLACWLFCRKTSKWV